MISRSAKTKITVTKMRHDFHVAAAVLVDIIREQERRGERERKGVKREQVRAFAFLLAFGSRGGGAFFVERGGSEKLQNLST
jgi:hypothetical protein